MERATIDRLEPPTTAERDSFSRALQRADVWVELWAESKDRGGIVPPPGWRWRVWSRWMLSSVGVVLAASFLVLAFWDPTPGTWWAVGWVAAVVSMMVVISERRFRRGVG
jgi:hypothetical protein